MAVDYSLVLLLITGFGGKVADLSVIEICLVSLEGKVEEETSKSVYCLAVWL